jgi:hypothetical protein
MFQSGTSQSKADAAMTDVRYWPKADISFCTAHVRFPGKADTEALQHPWQIGAPHVYVLSRRR